MVSNKEARIMGYVNKHHYKYYSYMTGDEYLNRNEGETPGEFVIDMINLFGFNLKKQREIEKEKSRPPDKVLTPEEWFILCHIPEVPNWKKMKELYGEAEVVMIKLKREQFGLSNIEKKRMK